MNLPVEICAIVRSFLPLAYDIANATVHHNIAADFNVCYPFGEPTDYWVRMSVVSTLCPYIFHGRRLERPQIKLHISIRLKGSPFIIKEMDRVHHPVLNVLLSDRLTDPVWLQGGFPLHALNFTAKWIKEMEE